MKTDDEYACPDCGAEEDEICTKLETVTFAYGQKAVPLTCLEEVHTCLICKFVFTGQHAELARDAAVTAYLTSQLAIKR
jgi:rubredoxin